MISWNLPWKGNQISGTCAIEERSRQMTGKPDFIGQLEKRGFCASVVSSKHLGELGEEIRALHREGKLYDELFRQYETAYFSPRMPRSLPNAKSIIIVATPQPMIRTTIHWKGRTLRFVVPPTYYDNDKVTRLVRRELKKALGRRQYKLVRASLPQKLLAVKSGLAMYGRNNITYIPRFGSLHRLTSFFTDYDSPVDCWQEKRALPLCSKCTACLRACPTGAIVKDRFLIHVERCLTYLNEKDSKHAFPKWVSPDAHNALIGCMRCQKACPYDKEVVERYEDRGEFSEQDVAYLLKGEFEGPKAVRMQRKLKRLGLDLSVFPRNLKVLLDRE
jgi:epoxyqueuosine reductase